MDPGRRAASAAAVLAGRRDRSVVRSMPSNSTRPELNPGGRSRQRASVDFPQPDSPTSPKVSPRQTVERDVVEDGYRHLPADARRRRTTNVFSTPSAWRIGCRMAVGARGERAASAPSYANRLNALVGEVALGHCRTLGPRQRCAPTGAPAWHRGTSLPTGQRGGERAACRQSRRGRAGSRGSRAAGPRRAARVRDALQQRLAVGVRGAGEDVVDARRLDEPPGVHHRDASRRSPRRCPGCA